ncbi:golgin subfamily A member 6-like protein 22 [Bombus vosnesenskii]|uniref:Golgin subfamily A member 6-like protein 22 n=1 Tax=Bombus vosnesenskii TaxID=207650 RepID=A0A6J3LBH4_9HYME|nr:golgin subfamily A member 6-like protein 22 [Bombus vosnesenskii]
MKVGKRVESDHMPLEIETEGPEVQRDEERKGEEKERREWTKESAGRYLEECKGWASRGRTVEEMWAEIKKKINEAIPKKKVRIRKWSIGEKVWYDKELKEREREIRRKMTKFRKGKCSREEFIEEKKALKQWCKQRKEKQEEEEMEKINKLKTKQEAWKYINKYRRRRKVVGEEIREEEWKNHFMETLEGTENKEDRRTEGRREEEESKEEREDNIEKEEVIFQIRNLTRLTRHKLLGSLVSSAATSVCLVWSVGPGVNKILYYILSFPFYYIFGHAPMLSWDSGDGLIL